MVKLDLIFHTSIMLAYNSKRGSDAC